jgi:aryl-alcohol dehydrogenase-like predicted oxidoreductase
MKCLLHPRGRRGGSRRGGGVEPLRQRVELGAFLSDTAKLYGPEEIVGRAVQGRRDQVFVATKTGGS